MASFHPKKEIDKYNKMVEDRGYSYFSKESEKDYYNRYNHNKSYADVHKESDIDEQLFMNKVRNISQPQHLEARDRYKNEFDCDPTKVKQHFRQKLYDKYGFGKFPMKNDAYEKRVLTPEKIISTPQASAELETFKQLMKAKWKAVGYDGDDKVIADFKNYTIDLCLK